MKLCRITKLSVDISAVVVNLLQGFEDLEASHKSAESLLLLHQQMEREWIVPLRKTKLKERHQGHDVWLG